MPGINEMGVVFVGCPQVNRCLAVGWLLRVEHVAEELLSRNRLLVALCTGIGDVEPFKRVQEICGRVRARRAVTCIKFILS